MKMRFLSLIITTAFASLASCQTVKQPATVNFSIVGKHLKLVELNGVTVQLSTPSGREPHMMLNASDKRVSGNGGCNSFFGGYELQGNDGITFSKMGSTRMACADDAMQVESHLFQALEMTNNYQLRNDTLSLTKADMSPVAKFVLSEPK